MITKILSFKLDNVIFDIVGHHEFGEEFINYAVYERGLFERIAEFSERNSREITDDSIIEQAKYETENVWHFKKMNKNILKGA